MCASHTKRGPRKSARLLSIRRFGDRRYGRELARVVVKPALNLAKMHRADKTSARRGGPYKLSRRRRRCSHNTTMAAMAGGAATEAAEAAAAIHWNGMLH